MANDDYKADRHSLVRRASCDKLARGHGATVGRRLAETSRSRVHLAALATVVSHYRAEIGASLLSREQHFWCCEVIWTVHLLEYIGHALLSTLLFSHLRQLTFRNGCLLVTLLQLLVSQEVLSHDPGDLFEVVKDGETSVFLFLFGRAESAELVVQVESCLWPCLAVHMQTYLVVTRE